MKPDDADAENDLDNALGTKLPASEIPGIPKEELHPARPGPRGASRTWPTTFRTASFAIETAMRLVLAATLMLSVVAGEALANGTQDGNAGLDALNRGDNKEAIRLFTRALADKSLAPDDREFAYASRAKAEMAEGDATAATRDLEQAVRLKPDDTEALADLQAALARGRGAVSRSSGERSGPATAAARDPWGLYGAGVGKYFWYEVAGKDPHLAYQYASWITPRESISTVVRNKRGVAAAAETKLDPDTNRLISVARTGAGTLYSTSTADATLAVDWTWSKGHAVRTSSRLQADGSVAEVSETFDNGAWTVSGRATLVEVTKEALRSEGFKVQ